MAALPDPQLSRAVLVGTSTYHHLDGLPAVHNNLTGLRDILTDAALGGLPADNCTILEEPGSGGEVYKALRDQAIAAEDTFLAYFAGHGRLGDRNELHLCLPDTEPDLLSFTALAYKDLRAAVAQGRAVKKVVILDCCFSGRAVADMAGDEETIAGQVGIEGSYILTATPANEVAMAPPGEQYTAFTGVLLDLLRTGIAGGRELLTFADIYPRLKYSLASRQLPQPRQRGSETIIDLALTRNPAFTRHSQQTSAGPPGAEPKAQPASGPAGDRAATETPGLAERGPDVETEATLSFSDAMQGGTVQLRLVNEDPCGYCHGTGSRSGIMSAGCPACKGTGQVSRSMGSFTLSRRCRTCQGRGRAAHDPCPACSGSGRIVMSRTLMARVPAGIKDGQRIRLKGRGRPSKHGGPNGDLYVRVQVTPAAQTFETLAPTVETIRPDSRLQRQPRGGPVVAIDFGMTNSAVAVLKGTDPTVIPNAEGSKTTPSVVAFAKNGEVLVGEVAKRQALTNAGRTIRSVKSQLGTDWTVRIDGKKFTAQQVSAFIYQKLKRDAEAHLGGKITDAVITVPANFSDAQRRATREACEIAGLNVLRIISEPTAAALAYHLENETGTTILVFNLSGGTYSVSLLKVGAGVVEVKATSGDNHVGGNDWDQRIIDQQVQDFKDAFGIDLSKDRLALQRLYEAAEKAKVELSSSRETTINLPYITHSAEGPLHLDATLTRAEFQHMTSDLLGLCTAPFQQVIKDGGIGLGDIHHVVLAGGATRMPAFVDLVRQLTGGKQLSESISPDEVVAVGACLQAGVLSGLGPRTTE